MLVYCMKVKALVAQSCPTACNPMSYCSPPGFSVHGIVQARILVRAVTKGILVGSSQGDLPNPGIKPGFPGVQVVSRPIGKPTLLYMHGFILFH